MVIRLYLRLIQQLWLGIKIDKFYPLKQLLIFSLNHLRLKSQNDLKLSKFQPKLFCLTNPNY